jgi:hypothetical protein
LYLNSILSQVHEYSQTDTLLKNLEHWELFKSRTRERERRRKYKGRMRPISD